MQKSTQNHLSLTIGDPVALLGEVADRYPSADRVLMEFVDNPFDDAEEMFRENGGKEYPRLIRIKVHLNSKTRSVVITDNCRGMLYERLVGIVSNVGKSPKRGCSWLNGRFGFGIHAFRAIAKSIRIRTKHADGELCEISFSRDQMDNIESRQFGDAPLTEEISTGTEVTLSSIDTEVWKNITAESIKEAIEHHFETLLKRPNLEVTVQKDAATELLCRPFDYSTIEGQEFQQQFTIKKGDVLYPVQMYLKVSKVAYKNLAPRFFSKGRRINDMRAIASFINRSIGRTRVWGHDHLIGYIEVGEALTPVITRDDFKSTALRELVYTKILENEDDIKAALEEINNRQRDSQMNRLAGVFSKVLSDFARADLMRMRSEQPTGDDDGDGVGDRGSKGGRKGGTDVPSPPGGERPPDGRGRNGDGNGDGNKKSRDGLSVTFHKLGPDFEGVVPRSNMLEGTIVVNTAHAQFDCRASRTRQGGFRMNDRLLSYICGVIAFHYKSAFYDRYGRQPEARDQLFEDQFDLQCKLEEALMPHIGTLQQQLNDMEDDVA